LLKKKQALEKRKRSQPGISTKAWNVTWS
jgi:hypothetical protein